MKKAFSFAIICLALSLSLGAQEGASKPAVIVEDLKIDLASSSRQGSWIFNKVAQRRDVEALGESRFEDWNDDYRLYFDAIVEKATELGLHDRGLESVMKAISADFNKESDVGYIPVAAFKAHKRSKPVWIIVYHWGYSDERYGHVMYYLYQVSPLSLLDSESCK